MSNSKTSAYYFLSLDSLFEGGRMFVGAISAAYLLKRGISLEQIANLKIIQALVFIFLEVPTGVIADVMGRRFSLFSAVLSGLLGFLFYFFGTNFYFFIAGEILAALSICFWSGAFEAYALDSSTAGNTKEDTSIFFHRLELWGKNLVMLSGFIGGLMAVDDFATPYLVAAGTFLFLLVMLLLGPKETQNKKIEHEIHYHFKEQIAAVLKEGAMHPKLKKYFGFMVLVQFCIQPLLHYWQPFFLNIESSLGGPGLGRIFLLYCAAAALGSWIVTLVIQKNKSTYQLFGFPLFVLFLFLYSAMSFTQNLTISIVLFCLAQMFFSISRSQVQAEFSSQIPAKHRASVLSGLSLISRFGMISSLGLIQLFGVIFSHNRSISADLTIVLFRWFPAIGLLIFGVLSISRKFCQKQ